MQWDVLYQKFLADIEKCRNTSLPEKEQIESAFETAINYWEDIKRQLAGNLKPCKRRHEVSDFSVLSKI